MGHGVQFMNEQLSIWIMNEQWSILNNHIPWIMNEQLLIVSLRVGHGISPLSRSVTTAFRRSAMDTMVTHPKMWPFLLHMVWIRLRISMLYSFGMFVTHRILQSLISNNRMEYQWIHFFNRFQHETHPFFGLIICWQPSEESKDSLRISMHFPSKFGERCKASEPKNQNSW